jgi:hypothetical protein
MSVAAAEMPPKPNTPAMMATISPRSRCVVLGKPGRERIVTVAGRWSGRS